MVGKWDSVRFQLLHTTVVRTTTARLTAWCYTFHSFENRHWQIETIKKGCLIFCKFWQYWVQIFQEYVRRSAQSHLYYKYEPLVGSIIISKMPRTSKPRVMGVPSERFHTHSYLQKYWKWAAPIRKQPFRFFRSVKISVWTFIRNSVRNFSKISRKNHTFS